MYWGREGEFTTHENAISIIYNGAIAAGKVYAQREPTGVLAESYFIALKNGPRKHSINLFLAAILERTLYPKYSRDYLATWKDRVENESIQLPVKDGAIDFDFIEEFIAELEAYLQATELDDYTLTPAEITALENFTNLEWVEYNLEALFGKSTRGKRLKSSDRTPGNLPFITAGEANTGISSYIGNQVEIFPKNTVTIDMFGSAKYRGYAYGADDHIAVVHTEKLSRLSCMFLATTIEKSSHNGQFDYSRNFYAKDADALNIMLPVQDREIYFSYMTTFINAIQKLVIKDVVDYARTELAATEQTLAK